MVLRKTPNIMCKILFTFLLTISSIVAFGQARLGSTASEIRSEFWESRYKLKNDDIFDIYGFNGKHLGWFENGIV
jgi:hypothetical protein